MPSASSLYIFFSFCLHHYYHYLHDHIVCVTYAKTTMSWTHPQQKGPYRLIFCVRTTTLCSPCSWTCSVVCRDTFRLYSDTQYMSQYFEISSTPLIIAWTGQQNQTSCYLLKMYIDINNNKEFSQYQNFSSRLSWPDEFMTTILSRFLWKFGQKLLAIKAIFNCLLCLFGLFSANEWPPKYKCGDNL